jgi:putative transposase
VVGWQLASHMRTTLVLDALRMALGTRPPGADVALVHHSDRGSHPDLTQNIGQTQPLAESFVDSFKTELICDRVWRTRSQLELAVVEYLGWFNHTRLHERLGDLPPAEFEALALLAQAAPHASEGLTITGRPLRSPVASEILIS